MPPEDKRGRVIGIGGVFFKSARQDGLSSWYEQHLGFQCKLDQSVVFEWIQPEKPGLRHRTVWAIFSEESKYFDPSKASFMINYIVDDLDAILERLRAEGVSIDPNRETDSAGRFAWIYDSDGNKIELWEPVRTPPPSPER